MVGAGPGEYLMLAAAGFVGVIGMIRHRSSWRSDKARPRRRSLPVRPGIHSLPTKFDRYRKTNP